jgi:plasmid stabilization system protein ParE
LRERRKKTCGKSGVICLPRPVLEIADRIQGGLVDTLEHLSDFPGKGHRRPDLTSRDVLFFRVYQYMIVYRRMHTIEIIAILHSKRDLKRLLKTRPL